MPGCYRVSARLAHCVENLPECSRKRIFVLNPPSLVDRKGPIMIFARIQERVQARLSREAALANARSGAIDERELAAPREATGPGV